MLHLISLGHLKEELFARLDASLAQTYQEVDVRNHCGVADQNRQSDQ